jgi:hypothetical protein
MGKGSTIATVNVIIVIITSAASDHFLTIFSPDSS